MATKFKMGDRIGFRPTGTEITGVHYEGTPPSLWHGFVNGDVGSHGGYVPVFCERLGGLEAITIMVAPGNIEAVNGQSI